MLLALGLTTGASAETAVVTSLEWLTCSAELIVVGKIDAITTVKGPNDVAYEDCLVNVQRVIKGRVEGKQLAFTLRQLGGVPTARPLLKSKASALLFLSKSKNNGPEHRLDGQWVPTTGYITPPVIDLSRPAESVYTKDMKPASDIDALLKTVERWAKSRIEHSMSVEVPFDSPIFSKLWGGSAVLMIVPAEEKYREKWMKLVHSPKPYDRAQAAAELSKFPGEQTEAALRELLKDDSEQNWNYAQDLIEHVEFFVRAAAYHSLQALGKTVPELKLQRKPTAEEQRSLRAQVWRASFAAALKDGWTISVGDGPTREFDGRRHTVVIVTCRREQQTAKFTLFPKQWPVDGLPKTESLGVNGVNSQGARRFYLEGALPTAVKQQVVSYFGLK